MASPINAGGLAILRINGVQYSARGSFEVQPLAVSAQSGRNVDLSTYYTEKPEVSYIKGELTDAGNIPLGQFRSMRGDYVTVELSNGKTYGIANAVYEGLPTLDATEGRYPIQFSGDVVEITA